MKPIIAVDGPAGSGKGTMARKLANHFGFAYLDSGMIYRAFACMDMAFSDNNSALNGLTDNSDFLDTLSDIFRIEDDENNFNNYQFYGNAGDFIESIQSIPENVLRSEIIGMEASKLAKLPEIREIINNIMREFAANPGEKYFGTILDGRDIGTVVFPNADCKIFLTSSAEIRAKRRFESMKSVNPNISFDEIYKNLKTRDEQDYSRGIAPLSFDESYIIVDNSIDTIEESFIKLTKIIESSINNRKQ
jgi:cytidylate kinase